MNQELFADLTGANVAFQHWHPVPVTANGNKLAGQGEMGGVWEWTSTALSKHDGFEPMPLYPAYTGITFYTRTVYNNMLINNAADFFDGKHNIILGGSWATHSRIAGRKTLYVFSFRSAKDGMNLTVLQCQLVSTQLPLCLGWC